MGNDELDIQSLYYNDIDQLFSNTQELFPIAKKMQHIGKDGKIAGNHIFHGCLRLMGLGSIASKLLEEHRQIMDSAISGTPYVIKESLLHPPPKYENMYIKNLQIEDHPEKIQINIPKSFLSKQDYFDFFDHKSKIYAGEFYRAKKFGDLPSSFQGTSQIPLTCDQARLLAVEWIDAQFQDVVLLHERDGANPLYWEFDFGYVHSEEVWATILVHKKTNEIVPYMIRLG
ncbi:hypothetical protein [Candidatus Lokiarchaeum ossiferum]|uniref:hypothetical protein n=1 Tax=Candidatus Lokiarchaeum ossiferum TaxID=2951803 RepID=UPI00352F1CCB